MCCAGAAPVPVRDSEPEGFEALLRNDMLPDADPLVCGRKVTVNVALCPTPIVTGKANPLRTNSELLEVAEVTVTAEPLAVTVPV